MAKDVSVHLTKAQLNEAAASLRKELLSGGEPTDIADTYGWDADTYEAIRRHMLDGEADRFRTRSPEQAYVEYTLEMGRDIYSLTELIKNLNRKSQFNALVGAIRLRAEIADRILDRGLEFGVIKKQPDGRLGGGNILVLGDLRLNDMSVNQLREAILSQFGELNAMITKHGERSIIDMETGKLHYDAPPALVAETSIRRTPGKKKAKG